MPEHLAEDRRADLALGGLVRLLEYSGEARWLKWARDHLETLRRGGLDPRVLDAYGGPGSFNTLVLGPERGHALEAMQAPWANRLLAVLGERLYQLALELTDERFEAGWAEPPDPPIDGRVCPSCGYAEIGDLDIEWWAARVLVPAHVGDGTLAEGANFIDRVLSGQLLGAAESRADVMARAAASGVGIAYRDGEAGACDRCGHEPTVAAQWVLAGGGLHPAGGDTGDDWLLEALGASPAGSLGDRLTRAGALRIAPGLWHLGIDGDEDRRAAAGEVARVLGDIPMPTFLSSEAHPAAEGWSEVSQGIWRLDAPECPDPCRDSGLAGGVWQIYVAPAPVAEPDLPDLFRADSANAPHPLEGSEVVAMIEAWKDNREWRIAVATGGVGSG